MIKFQKKMLRVRWYKTKLSKINCNWDDRCYIHQGVNFLRQYNLTRVLFLEWERCFKRLPIVTTIIFNTIMFVKSRHIDHKLQLFLIHIGKLSLCFKLDKLDWGAVFSFSFKVDFDPERSLKPANYSIVTPVQLLYYDEYNEDEAGVVVSKGQYYSHPLDKVAFNIELPG